MKHVALFSLALSLASTLAASTAHADQCAWVAPSVAEHARRVLSRPGTEVLEYCEPCRERLADARPMPVRSVKVRAVRGGQLRELVVNGRAVDLAYLFARAPGTGASFTNVGLGASCAAQRVSPAVQLPAASPGFRPGFVCPPGSRCGGAPVSR